MEGPELPFIVYRILGNDLPPRHEAGQTYRNLRFVLDHEPAFAGCDKRWIINRIVDPYEEQRLIDLLEERDQRYLRIPFLIDEYRACIDRELSDDQPRGKGMDGEDGRIKHNNQHYTFNNNGARNLALREGRRTARWVLPLDGNCCFTEEGWNHLAHKIAQQSKLDGCFVIPMYRLRDNGEFFGFQSEDREQHEPQVILGRDSNLEFNESYRYGYRSKMELLLRLGVEYRLSYAMEILDENCKCGYVLRLFSGVPEAEGDWRRRGPLRIQAIDLMLSRLDERAGLTMPRRAAA